MASWSEKLRVLRACVTKLKRKMAISPLIGGYDNLSKVFIKTAQYIPFEN